MSLTSDITPAEPCEPLDADDSSFAATAAAPLPAGSWLAILGGGQLGSMFSDAAHALGFRVVALDPDADAPIASRADALWTASFQDRQALAAMGEQARAATVEFENIPYAALAYLAMRMPVRPAADSIAIAQDRIEEKTFFARNGLPVGPFMVLREASDLANVQAHLLPGQLKTTRLGYDGKGQRTVASPDDLAEAFQQLGNVPCVLEQFLDLHCEISVLVARDAQGNTAVWPAAENMHHNGILDVSIVPARVSPRLIEEASAHALKVVDAMGYRGVLCIEFFIDREGHLYINEMAPRPHNSGHHTIESCVTSQFEQQVRITADLPLGDTTQRTPVVMQNLLGDLWFRHGDVAREPDWTALLSQLPGTHLHLYGKKEARRGRKMGHITCCGRTLDDALHTLQTLRQGLGLPPLPSRH